MAARDLYDAMAAVFDVAAAALNHIPIEEPGLDGCPDCAYIEAGPPSWDSPPCLIVYSGGPVLADTLPLAPALNPAHRIAIMAEVDMVSITTTILRCAAVIGEDGKLPTVVEHETVSLQASSDLWAIWNGFKDAKRTGLLFPPSDTREIFLDPAVALNQQGGACGWQITLRTQLDGYRPFSEP